MRVTQNQITRQYLNNSNRTLKNMSDIESRILSQRKFSRASEDSVGAAKALVIRRNLQKIDTYEANLTSAQGIFNSAETSLLTVSSVTSQITDKLIYGINGTNGQDEKTIIANELRNLADQIVSSLNVDYAERNLFSGTNNSSPGIVYDKGTGLVTYNGVSVASDNLSDYPNTKPIYVDIGLGIKYDSDGNVDPQTALNTSFNAIDFIGYGRDADGDPKNLIELAHSAAEALETGDINSASRYLEKIKDSQSELLVGITNIGNLEQTVDYHISRVKDDKLNLQTSQKAVEGIDQELEIINYKVAEMAYNALLSMGSKLVPMSIFDFMS